MLNHETDGPRLSVGRSFDSCLDPNESPHEHTFSITKLARSLFSSSADRNIDMKRDALFMFTADSNPPGPPHGIQKIEMRVIAEFVCKKSPTDTSFQGRGIFSS